MDLPDERPGASRTSVSAPENPRGATVVAMVNSTPAKALLVVGTLALLLACVASASAKVVTFAGSGTQAGHPAVGMDFDLNGKTCPSADCLKHAKITRFLAVSYGFPICPETLLESAFEFKEVMKVQPNRTFKGSGVIPDSAGGSSTGDVVTIHGKFSKKGKSASGTFTVDRGGCLTGTVPWTAVPD